MVNCLKVYSCDLCKWDTIKTNMFFSRIDRCSVYAGHICKDI